MVVTEAVVERTNVLSVMRQLAKLTAVLFQLSHGAKRTKARFQI
jgi:hypothetical protein